MAAFYDWRMDELELGKIWAHPGHLSLKIHYVKFDITVPPCKLYIENQTLQITMRANNSVQMSI